MNVIRVKATTEGFPGETNFSVICEDGSFYSFNARYAHEPEMLNIEMKDFLENGDTTDFSHTRMNIHFRELAGESPLLVKLIMQSIYKEDRREIRHLGCKRFGVQFLLKSRRVRYKGDSAAVQSLPYRHIGKVGRLYGILADGRIGESPHGEDYVVQSGDGAARQRTASPCQLGTLGTTAR